MLGLGYRADVSGRPRVNLSPRFPCSTFGPGGFILQSAATTRYSGYQLALGRANQQFYTTEKEVIHQPAAIHADVQLQCISQQSYKG